MFLATLGDAVRERGWRCLAYCVMPNHYPPAARDSRSRTSVDGMQCLNGTYASRYNAAHERVGPRVPGPLPRRAGPTPTSTCSRRSATSRSIRSVPDSRRDAGAWRWSSHGATAGLRASRLAPRGDVLGLVRTDPPDRTRRRSSSRRGRRPQTRPAARSTSPSVRHRRALAMHGYTQAEIAAHLGVSQPTVSRMLSAAATTWMNGAWPGYSAGADAAAGREVDRLGWWTTIAAVVCSGTNWNAAVSSMPSAAAGSASSSQHQLVLLEVRAGRVAPGVAAAVAGRQGRARPSTRRCTISARPSAASTARPWAKYASAVLARRPAARRCAPWPRGRR